MANEEHLKILKQGVKVWNKWREDNPEEEPDFRDTDLEVGDYEGANFSKAVFLRSFLRGVNFDSADLRWAALVDTDLTNASLKNATLQNSDLFYAKFELADLRNANLRGADLRGAIMIETNVEGADFYMSMMGGSTLGNLDLSDAKGLEMVVHQLPSTIGIDTLYKSGDKIPENFLRGCGVPDDFITFIPSHFGVQQAIQFYSCFISYSTKDEEFALRLYSRMRDEKLRVWFAPEDIKAGRKLHEQIERAIQLHDRLLIILSEESMRSEWVMSEIRNARQVEIKENRQKLFPIGLANFESIKKWKCFDSDTGKDLAVELREYYIPDFSNWKDHDTFEREFGKLLRDLRDEEKKQAEKRS